MTEPVVEDPKPDAALVDGPGAQGTPSGDGQDSAGEPETFDRGYVQKLRDEAATHRVKAKRVDEAVARLTSQVIASRTAGVLADPTDLPVTEDLLDEDGWPDPEKIETAARDLVARKPHLASRKPTGDVGQGVRGDDVEAVSLAALLRAGAS